MNFFRGVVAVVALSVAAYGQVASKMASKSVTGQPISPVVKVGTMTFTTKGGVSEPVALVKVAREAGSGMATGRRMHKPFVITKELDRTSPLLMNAMNNHEVISSMVITLDGSSKDAAKASGLGGGKVSMQDISILKIQKISPTMEEVTCEYASVVVKSADGKPMAEDDWVSMK